jgi:hypothetical protein
MSLKKTVAGWSLSRKIGSTLRPSTSHQCLCKLLWKHVLSNHSTPINNTSIYSLTLSPTIFPSPKPQGSSITY